MPNVKKSRRGVYYDLTASPYEFKSPYGDVFKFSSQKKLEIFTRDIEKELARLERILARNELKLLLPSEIVQLLRKYVYRSFYRNIEG